MKVVKFTFKPKTKSIDDFRISLLLTDFLNALRSNGQIQEHYTVIKNNDDYSAYITLIDTDSLSEKYDSGYVQEHKRKIQSLYNIAVEPLGENIDSEEHCCGCESRSGYILFSNLIHSGSPIHCLDCWCEMPLYQLPNIQEQKDYHGEVLWAHHFMKSVDALSTFSWAKRWSKRQLTNPNSELSKIGRKICWDFEKATGKPFYYYLIVDHEKSKLRERCPVCEQHWRELEIQSRSGHIIELYVCDQCRLALDQ